MASKLQAIDTALPATLPTGCHPHRQTTPGCCCSVASPPLRAGGSGFRRRTQILWRGRGHPPRQCRGHRRGFRERRTPLTCPSLQRPHRQLRSPGRPERLEERLLLLGVRARLPREVLRPRPASTRHGRICASEKGVVQSVVSQGAAQRWRHMPDVRCVAAVGRSPASTHATTFRQLLSSRAYSGRPQAVAQLTVRAVFDARSPRAARRVTTPTGAAAGLPPAARRAFSASMVDCSKWQANVS